MEAAVDHRPTASGQHDGTRTFEPGEYTGSPGEACDDGITAKYQPYSVLNILLDCDGQKTTWKAKLEIAGETFWVENSTVGGDDAPEKCLGELTIEDDGSIDMFGEVVRAAPGITGYIYGQGSAADETACVQAVNFPLTVAGATQMGGDCANGAQSTRLWKYESWTGLIRNVSDPSYCLQIESGVLYAPITTRLCDQPNDGIAWVLNPNGNGFISMRAQPTFVCMAREGAKVRLLTCDVANQNVRWKFTGNASGS